MPEPLLASDPPRTGAAPTVAQVAAVLDALYPPAFAESWDTGIGLSCGDPEAPVRTVLLAVDVTASTVEEAIAADADLLLTHHPLLFRPVQSVAADSLRGRLLHRAMRAGTHGLALYAAHTNADSNRPGVSDALAVAVGLVPGRPLQPLPGNGPEEDLLITYVPNGDVENVVDAMAQAGAGVVGDYTRCAYLGSGVGTFLPGPGARPAIGVVGTQEEVPETRLEMVLPRTLRGEVVAALRQAHPYEEVPFHLLAKDCDQDRTNGGPGMGRLCTTDGPVPARVFARRVAEALDVGAGGVRMAGDPDRLLSTVAVCGGAGDSLVGRALDLGADAFLTADLRHHVTSDAVADGLVMIDAGHYATERPWLDQAADRLRAELTSLGLAAPTCVVSQMPTDPWVRHLPGETGETGRDRARPAP